MIWLARHGETTWNAAGRYQGRLESHLSALGERQAGALGAFFASERDRGAPVPQRIVSSPLARTLETAAPLAAALGIAIETDARLLEIAHGTWEGRYREELERDDPQRYLAWRAAPHTVRFDGGEALRDVADRWLSFAADGRLAAGADVLVMTHDAVVRCALLALKDEPLAAFWSMRVENASFAAIDDRARPLRLLEECRTDHLTDARAPIATQAL